MLNFSTGFFVRKAECGNVKQFENGQAIYERANQKRNEYIRRLSERDLRKVGGQDGKEGIAERLDQGDIQEIKHPPIYRGLFPAKAIQVN